MKRARTCLLLTSLALAPAAFADDGASREQLVIAHRGASGYLPEHSLEAKVMAYMMGADYIEQDVVLTRDDVAVVLHDTYLDAVTDVASRFPGRAREDGRHYAVDFTLDELRTLSMHERVNPRNGTARYRGRFPAEHAMFRIHTLDEELALLRALDGAFGRETGIYVELKDPAWHRLADKDIAAVVLDVLARHGYRDGGDRVFLQSFDDTVLRRLGGDGGTGIALVQLVGDDRWWPNSTVDYARMRTAAGLSDIAGYADAVGLWLGHLLADSAGNAPTGAPRLIRDARAAGLAVHVYTLRRDALPEGFASFDELLEWVYDELAVDGAFTDFPDLARQYLDTR